ncbi:DNA repair protein [Cyclospora cayetanensis]|uniref:DNA repair protein n=1 Tax=Cyclospora cayetanensis TaxID=88456 RepID=A0A1D3D7Y4_9EIME|nr:DNA repair protein [Cyclospora cayetanensis]
MPRQSVRSPGDPSFREPDAAPLLSVHEDVEVNSAAVAAAAYAVAEEGSSLDAALGLGEVPHQSLEDFEEEAEGGTQNREESLILHPESPWLCSKYSAEAIAPSSSLNTGIGGSSSAGIDPPKAEADPKVAAAAAAQRKARASCIRRAQDLEKVWLFGWAAWLQSLNSIVLEGCSSSRSQGSYSCTPLLQGACLASYIAFCTKAQNQQDSQTVGTQRSRRLLLQHLQQLHQQVLQAKATAEEAQQHFDQRSAPPSPCSAAVVGQAPATTHGAGGPDTKVGDCYIPADGFAAFCFIASFQLLPDGRLQHPFFCASMPHAAAAAAATRRAQHAQQHLQQAAAMALVPRLSAEQSGAFTSVQKGGAAGLLAVPCHRALAGEQQAKCERMQQHQQPLVKRENSGNPASGAAVFLDPLLPLASGRRRPFPFGFSSLLAKSLRALSTCKAPSALLAVLFVALCRALGLTARLVVQLPPAGLRIPKTEAESACLSPPPQGLVRLFAAAGLPIPPFAAAAKSPCASAAASTAAEGESYVNQRKKAAAQRRGPLIHQETPLQACPYDSLFTITKAATASLAKAAPQMLTADGRIREAPTRLLPHRRQRLDTIGVAVAGQVGKNVVLSPLSRSETLQLLQLPESLQVWGEFFCPTKKRWIACVLKGPHHSIYDAADVLAGRRPPTPFLNASATPFGGVCPARARDLVQEAVQQRFLRRCCTTLQHQLDALREPPHEMAEEAALIADEFAAAWKQCGSGSRKKRSCAALLACGTTTPTGSSRSSNDQNKSPTVYGGGELLGSDFLRARKQAKGRLLQPRLCAAPQEEAQKKQQQQSITSAAEASLATAAAVVLQDRESYVQEAHVEVRVFQPSLQGQEEQHHQDQQHLNSPALAGDRQSRATVRFVLAVEASGTLKDVTHRYVSSWQQVLQQRGARLHQWWESAQVRKALQREGFSASGEGSLGVNGISTGDDGEGLGAKEETPEPLPEAQRKQQIAEAEEMERKRLIASEPLPTARRGFIDSPKDVVLLKTARQWRREHRRVKEGEEPLKTLKVGALRPPSAHLASLSTAQVLRRYPHLLRQQQHEQRQQQLSLQQMWSHRRLAYTAKNPCLRAALQKQESLVQPRQQTQEIGLFAQHQTEPMERDRVSDGRVPAGPQGTIEVGELAPVPLGTVHLSVAEWQQANARSALSGASAGQALQTAVTEILGSSDGGAWAPAVIGFERDISGAWRALRDGVVVLDTAAASVKERWHQITAEREGAAARRREQQRNAKLQLAYRKWRTLFKAILYAASSQQEPLHQRIHQQEQQLVRAAAAATGNADPTPHAAAAVAAGVPTRDTVGPPTQLHIPNREAHWETI